MKRTLRRSTRRAVRAGFTLIELLAVIVIIGILAVFLLPQIPAAFDSARVAACQKNMSNIYTGLQSYYGKYSAPPRQSGVRFFTSLIERGVWENSTMSAKRLTCPAVLPDALPGLAGKDPTEWYVDGDLIDGSYSAYAGRNITDHPLRQWPPRESGKTILVADDNDPVGNHDTTTVVLFGDGSASAFELYEEREKATIDPESPTIIVGPESPIEELSKLSLD